MRKMEEEKDDVTVLDSSLAHITRLPRVISGSLSFVR